MTQFRGMLWETYPDRVLSSTPQTPVGLAITCVTLTRWPSGSVDTPTLVNTGGSEIEVRFCESVTVTNTGEDNVVSGVSVTVLVVVGDGVLTFAC